MRSASWQFREVAFYAAFAAIKAMQTFTVTNRKLHAHETYF